VRRKAESGRVGAHGGVPGLMTAAFDAEDGVHGPPPNPSPMRGSEAFPFGSVAIRCAVGSPYSLWPKAYC
jgi:hypothetical protein